LVNVDSEQRYLFVFDIAASTFTFMHEAFPVVSDEENEAKEELLTIDAVALIEDGYKVVVSSMYNSDLHVLYSATMSLVQVIRGRSRPHNHLLHRIKGELLLISNNISSIAQGHSKWGKVF